ncbi:MAG: protein kinase [Deltaproteobacteria bacterium]
MDWGTSDLGATNAPLPDRIGPYRILRKIGRGGMGVVLEAEDDEGQRVALKLIRPLGTEDDKEQLVARLLREAAAIQRVDHPGVVRLQRYGNVDGAVYLAMDYVTGVTLKAIQRRTSLDPATLLSLAMQLLNTLQHLHTAGIVHRDVKPDNVLIDTTGRAVLADFGIAWVADSAGITRPGEIVGSVGYLAPECFEGEPPSARSDLYALGRTLFEMAAVLPRARLPADLPILMQFERRLRVDWRRFPTQSPWPSVRVLIERLVAIDPELRYPSAEAAFAAAAQLHAELLGPPPENAHPTRPDVFHELTCYEPDATLSAFVEQLDLPARSFWAQARDDESRFEAVTVPPEGPRGGAGLQAPNTAQTPPSKTHTPPTPPVVRREPPSQETVASGAPDAASTLPHEPPRRSGARAAALGAVIGLALGAASMFAYANRPMPPVVLDPSRAAEARTRADAALEAGDLASAEAELSACVEAGGAACERPLQIVRALRGR